MTQHSVEFTNAVSQLTLQDIFFTALLYSLKVERDDNLTMPGGGPGVACTDGVRLIYRADTWRDMFTAQQRVTVLAHEILHVILYHSLRRGIRDPQRWNIAADHCVNLLLAEYKFSAPKGWLCDQKYKGMSAEQVYDLLPAEQDQGQGQGQDQGQGQGCMGGDVLDYDPTTPGNGGKSASDVEREIGINTEKALQSAKAAGQLSAGIKRMLGDAQVQREPWYQHLRRYMTALHSRQYNWSRINTRRAVLFGVVSPDMRTEAMGKVVVGIDCSGSISTAQIASMGAHLSDIASDCNPKSVEVIYFDSEVCHEETFEGPDYQIKLEPHGGGGTNFRPVFDVLEERHSDAQVLLMFTDLYGTFPDGCGACETVWVTPTKNRLVPFGEVIEADFND